MHRLLPLITSTLYATYRSTSNPYDPQILLKIKWWGSLGCDGRDAYCLFTKQQYVIPDGTTMEVYTFSTQECGLYEYPTSSVMKEWAIFVIATAKEDEPCTVAPAGARAAQANRRLGEIFSKEGLYEISEARAKAQALEISKVFEQHELGVH